MANIFEDFAGADLDRLTDCIKAIKQAGLSIDEHTQAGVNQSSGNVWVWSEDWSGAVACSIGFDVFWVYSCPECGEEWEFEDYAVMEQYASQFEGQCGQCEEVTAS